MSELNLMQSVPKITDQATFEKVFKLAMDPLTDTRLKESARKAVLEYWDFNTIKEEGNA